MSDVDRMKKWVKYEARSKSELRRLQNLLQLVRVSWRNDGSLILEVEKQKERIG